MSYTKGDWRDFKNWKTYLVVVSVRAKNPEEAKELVENGFDRSMSYEDKTVNKPEVKKVEESM